jgi:hypothetical protein
MTPPRSFGTGALATNPALPRIRATMPLPTQIPVRYPRLGSSSGDLRTWDGALMSKTTGPEGIARSVWRKYSAEVMAPRDRLPAYPGHQRSDRSRRAVLYGKPRPTTTAHPRIRGSSSSHLPARTVCSTWR